MPEIITSHLQQGPAGTETRAVRQPARPKTPTSRGAELTILAIDISKHDISVRASGGRQRDYMTPHSYEAGMDVIAAAKHDLLGDQPPAAVVASVAGRVSQDGQQIKEAGRLGRYGYVDKPFAEDIAEATGQTLYRVRILSRESAGAIAQRSSQPIRDRDGAYLTWNEAEGRLRGAVYTPEGYIIPHEEEGESLVEVMDNTYHTYRRAGLDVAVVTFPIPLEEETQRALAGHMQRNWGLYHPTAPQIERARFGEDSPLAGAENAAMLRAEILEGQNVMEPIVLFDGINAQELNGRLGGF